MRTAPVITKEFTSLSLPKENFQKTVNTPTRDFIISLDSKNKIYYLKKKKDQITSLKKDF